MDLNVPDTNAFNPGVEINKSQKTFQVSQSDWEWGVWQGQESEALSWNPGR